MRLVRAFDTKDRLIKWRKNDEVDGTSFRHTSVQRRDQF